MKLQTRLIQLGAAVALPLALAASSLAATTPSIFSKADAVTAVDPGQKISATVWLNMPQKKLFDDTVAKLYKPGSPTFHQWLKKGDLSKFTPTDAQLGTVKQQLASQGLTIESVGQYNMFIRVSGSAAKMQAAFHTEIKNLSIKGETVRAATTQPKLGGNADSLVMAVSGLTQIKMKPAYSRRIDPATGKPFPDVPLASVVSPDGLFYAGNCFRGEQTKSFSTGGALPKATYTGTRYGVSNNNTAIGSLPPCGYSPAQVTAAYGLPTAYSKGLDGTGQTIVIVEFYGSSTILDDANEFSSLYGLPPLTSSNFQIIYPLGTPGQTDPITAIDSIIETSLDVEWAHAVAPGANIVVLVAPSDYDSDISATLFYGVVNEFGGVISNSYGGPEAGYLENFPPGLLVYDAVNEVAAAFGISDNFSTGDDGDFQEAFGVKTVAYPSDSTYATAVGGTSLGLFSNGDRQFETGWGNNITAIVDGATKGPLDPPVSEGFYAGAGGGESQAFAKPSWQSSLPGSGRQLPDIAMLADPYTGAEFVYSSGGQQSVGVVGGTSLATPLFSGVWTLANQRASNIYGEPVFQGQAAPIVAALAGTNAVKDVTTYTTSTNVTGSITDSGGTTLYTADELAGPLENTTTYSSALFNDFSGDWFVLTFGTDSSLVVGPGWDNVTGFGRPNGYPFIDAVAKFYLLP